MQTLLVLYLVQNLLVLLFETAISVGKITCVMFGTKFTGIFIRNCYFGWKNYLCYYLKLPVFRAQVTCVAI